MRFLAVLVAWWEEACCDVAFAARLARRRQAASLVAVALLSVGVGANVAIYSLLSGALIRPLPYPNPDRLAVIGLAFGGHREFTRTVDAETARLLVESPGSFEGVARYSLGERALRTGHGGSEPIQCATVSPSLFDVLGVTAEHGRLFGPGDATPTSGPVALVSYSLWQRWRGSRQSALGAAIAVDDSVYTVVGVMPPGFGFPGGRAQMWVPLGPTPATLTSPNVARLRPGATVERASAEVTARAAASLVGFSGVRGRATLLRDDMNSEARPALLVLQIAVALLLATTCISIALVSGASARARRREFSTRLALGASRGRLVRQCVAEGALTSLVATMVGVVMAHWVIRWLVVRFPAPLRSEAGIGLDGHVLLFALALSALTTLLVALAPIGESARLHPRASAGEGQRGADGPRARFGGEALLAVEVTFCCMLVVGAGLLAGNLLSLMSADRGCQADGVLTARVPSGVALRVIEAMAGLPDVRSIGATSRLPGTAVSAMGVVPEGWLPGSHATSQYANVTSGYQAAMGLRLASGRFLRDDDDEGARREVVINEAFSRRYFAGVSAIGKRIGGRLTVVGVVADVRYSGLTTETAPMMYLSYRSMPRELRYLVIRSRTTAGRLAPILHRTLDRLGALDGSGDVLSLEDRFSASLARPRFYAALLAALAGGALSLLSFSVYGLMAHNVQRRRRELGVRVALGAGAVHVVREVALPGIVAVFSGTAVGALAATGLAHWLRALVFGVSVHDLSTYVAAAAVVAGVAGLTALPPLLAAARRDPASCLRED